MLSLPDSHRGLKFVATWMLYPEGVSSH